MDPDNRILAMSLFVLVFLLVYGLMHTAFYLRVRVLLPPQGPARPALIFLLALLLLGPVFEHQLAGRGLVQASRVAGYVAYIWMGFLFLALCAGLCVRIYNGLASVSGPLFELTLPRFAGKAPAVLVLAVAMAGVLYGLAEESRLRIVRLTLSTDRLPAGMERVRIVQISDIHLGVLLGDPLARELASAAARDKP
ncbi:MAG: hypothetical protein AB1921_01760, partial [Thermodesulfobacteriota bacterium]